jgi:hypothetical protein
MANIGSNHKQNKFFSPVPKSTDHTCLLNVKKLILDLGMLGPFKLTTVA